MQTIDEWKSTAAVAPTRRLLVLAALTVAFVVPAHALDPKKSISQFAHASWSAKDGMNFGLGDTVRKNTILMLPAGGDHFQPTGEAVGMIWMICLAPDGVAWMSDTSDNCVRPVPGRGSTADRVELGGPTLCPLFDTDGGLWVGLVEGGLRRIPDVRHRAARGADRFGSADGLTAGIVYASFEDREGNLEPDSPAKPVVRRVVELMERVAVDGRNAVRGLRTQGDEDALDLDVALAKLLTDLAPSGLPTARVFVTGVQRPLHPLVRAEAFAVAREALVNALRHSGARSVEVETEYSPRHLRVLVRDDGRGIDEEALRSGRDGHYGLSGMRERAEKIGARLKVSSREGSGTEVELFVPGQSAFLGASTSRAARLWSRRNRAR